jgi:threonine dehydratase
MITLDDIYQARERIEALIHPTPLIACTGTRREEAIWFKPENLQPIGSFKIRGACNRVMALSPEERAAGVIAYSSGNHAQGVAFAAQRLGIKAVIVMPSNAPPNKVAATRAYGADVVLYDPAVERREEVTARLMQGQSWTLVPPFNDPYVIAGQGTIGLEILEELPDVELVLTPVGGGGLISGIAAALKSRKPDVKIVGVEPELAADAQASLRSGQLVEITPAEANRTIADGVRTLSLGDLTFAHIRRYVEDIVAVSESEIRAATRQILFEARLLVEPTAALPFAAWRYHRAELPPARQAVLLLSGGNIAPALLLELLQSP